MAKLSKYLRNFKKMGGFNCNVFITYKVNSCSIVPDMAVQDRVSQPKESCMHIVRVEAGLKEVKIHIMLEIVE